MEKDRFKIEVDVDLQAARPYTVSFYGAMDGQWELLSTLSLENIPQIEGAFFRQLEKVAA